jgi:lipoate-protein ligase A
MSHSVSTSYQKISSGLLEGFKNLGLNAVLAPKNKQHRLVPSSACFDAPSDYELLVEGKKIAGSAQTRQQDVLLQHGSILIDFNDQLLINSLFFSSEKEKEKVRETIKEKAVAINWMRQKEVPLDEVVRCFFDGFSKGLRIQLKKGELTNEERELSEELIHTRYKKVEWNQKR